MSRTLLFLGVALLLGEGSAVAQSRGELLYSTHCGECHTTQIHWRDNRSVNDWGSLTFQVKRWQDTASLGWTSDDILSVSRYLNDTIYHFKQAADAASVVRTVSSN